MEVRDVFFEQIHSLMGRDEDVFLVTADLAGGQYLETIKKEFPDRYISVGIAEQNLVLVASGLAAEGRKVICYAMNPFIIARALDQINNTISLMHLPVTLVGFHAGLSFATTGPSHAGTRDIAQIRTCDYMKCWNPMDYESVRQSIELFLTQEQGLYIRLDKDITWDRVNGEACADWKDGVRCLRKGTIPVSIITTGRHAKLLNELLDELSADDVCPGLISILSFPYDEEKLIDLVQESDVIITVEELLLQGGMSASVLEAFADHGVAKKVKRIGIDVRKGHPSFFGKRADVEKYLHLDKESLKASILEACNANSN